MSAELLSTSVALVAPSQETHDKIQAVHEALLRVNDVEIVTEHVLHGGLYCRTIRLGPGVVTVGSIIKQPTVLIVNGATSMLAGDGRLDLEGYNVLPGSAGRQSVRVTHGPVQMTMVYATQAKTVEEAEREVFLEPDLLLSRKDGSRDTYIVTGE